MSASAYRFPPRFLVLADMLGLALAFVVATRLASPLQVLFASDRAGAAAWLHWLSLTTQAKQAAGVPPFVEIAWIPLFMIPMTLVFLRLLGGYRQLVDQSRTRIALSCLFAPVLGLSFVTLVVTALRVEHTSRAFIFSLAFLSGLVLLTYRGALRYYKYRRLLAGHYARNIVVIGSQTGRAWLADHFAQTVSSRFYRLFGYLDVDSRPASSADAVVPEGRAAGLRRLGSIEDLGELLVRKPVHEVIVIQGVGSEAWLRAVIEQCEYFRISVRIVPEALVSWRSTELLVAFGSDVLRLPEIVLRPRYLGSDALFVKRVFDIVTSTLLLLLFSPVFLAIAIAIKLTTPRLPVFYPWCVVGYKGRTFTGYKFTTMQADADSRKADLIHLNEMTGPVFKIKEDPRITRFGRFLRKYSLNELPQLWSVLRGDMSLVGPRPAYPNELDRYELWQKRKLCVQPGITCLWQVRGRNRISNFDDWVRMDFEYIDNWSLWLDCRILVRTAWAVVAGSGS